MGSHRSCARLARTVSALDPVCGRAEEGKRTWLTSSEMRVVLDVVHPAHLSVLAQQPTGMVQRVTHRRLAVWSIPTTFLTIASSSSGTFIHSLNAAII